MRRICYNLLHRPPIKDLKKKNVNYRNNYISFHGKKKKNISYGFCYNNHITTVQRVGTYFDDNFNLSSTFSNDSLCLFGK